MTTPDELLDGPIARAYREAEQVRDEAEEARLLKEEADALAAMAEHVYDPRPEPEDIDLYEGTGIGALYGLPGSERFLPELGDWTIGKERRP